MTMAPFRPPWNDSTSWRAHGIALIRGQPWWAVLGVCFLVLWLRKPDALANPQFWAEDGMFFHTQYLWGEHTFLVAFNGYYLTVPRIVASLAARLDPALIPAFYVWSAIACTLYVCARTLSSRFPFPLHAGFALAVVLVPDAFEVLLNIANLQWILAAGLVLLLISGDPVTPGQKLHDIVAGILIGLTGPFSIVLLTFFLGRFWLRRSRWSGVVALVIAVTATIQGYAFTHFPASVVNEGTLAIGQGIGAAGFRTVGSLMLGSWLHLPLPLPFGWVLCGLGLAALLALAGRHGLARAERIMIAGAATFLVAAVLYRCRFTAGDLLTWGTGARYFFFVQLMLMWLLLTLWNASPVCWRRVAATTTFLFLIANVPRLREPSMHDFQWGDYAEALRAGEAVDIPINPPGWKIPVPARARQ